MDDQVYVQAKHIKTGEPLSSLMGPMSARSAERVIGGMLINIGSHAFVDEWPAQDGPNGGRQPA